MRGDLSVFLFGFWVWVFLLVIIGLEAHDCVVGVVMNP